MEIPMAVQFMEFVYKNDSIILLLVIFAIICFLPTYLKKLCAVGAFAVTVILLVLFLVLTAAYHPDPKRTISDFFDIFACIAVFLAVVVGVVRLVFLIKSFLIREELADPQTLGDIESGAGDLMMTTLTRKTATPPPPVTDEVAVNFSYKVDKKSAVFGGECVVCMEDLEEDDKCTMLRCAHVYHRECIEKWFVTAEQKLCPTCRSDPFEKLSDAYQKEKEFLVCGSS